MSYHDVDFDYEDEGGIIDPVWLLTICFGLGIWLVINRYKSLLNRAIFFRLAPPPVRTTYISLMAARLTERPRASKSKRHGQRSSCQSPR